MIHIDKKITITISESDVQTITDICEIVRVIFDVDKMRERFVHISDTTRGGKIDQFLEKIFHL